MTTVQINLPDQLFQEAQCAGLLTPATLDWILREYLKIRNTNELFAAMDRTAAVEEPAMRPEVIAEELHAIRVTGASRVKTCASFSTPTSAPGGFCQG